MDLKEKVLEILDKEKYSFKDLAEYVGMTEDALATALETKRLELRTLELISKGLKIPLYSFFRSDQPYYNKDEKPYYINKLWDDDEQKDHSDLSDEIALLKKMIEEKQAQLNKRK
jgi:transcriptional regulator with XRE-family HTH domain